MTRSEAVLALGASLLDYLPQARQSSSLLGAAPGLAGGKQKPCETCGARGRLTAKGQPCAACAPLLGEKSGRAHFGVRHGCKPCPICDGWGWLRTRDHQPYDGYTRSPLASESRPDTSKDLERRLQHTSRLLAEWERPETVAFAWEEAKRMQWRSGDYENLTRALNALERVAPRRHSLWWRKVVLAEPLMLSDWAALELERTTAFLARLMPGEIRVPAHLQPKRRAEERKASLWRGRTSAHGRQRAERDALIRQQAAQGWSQRRIADYHAISQPMVHKVLRSTASMAGTT